MLEDNNLENSTYEDENFYGLEYVHDIKFPEPSLEIVNAILSLCVKDIEHSVVATSNSKAHVGSRRYWATQNILQEIINGLSTYVNEKIPFAPDTIQILPPSDDYVSHIVQLHVDWAERNQRYFHGNRPGTDKDERTLNALYHIKRKVRKGLMDAERKYILYLRD